MITLEDAQIIAQTYIEEPGAAAETPKMVKIHNTSKYVVPVIITGKNVGLIYIDSDTGKNLGGAGGAQIG